MERKAWVLGSFLWAMGCSTTVAPLPDSGPRDPGPGDVRTDRMGSDPVPDDPRPDPGPGGESGPPDAGGGSDGAAETATPDVDGDSPGDDSASLSDLGSDAGPDSDRPPFDPCGDPQNPQCLPFPCRTAGGDRGTCLDPGDGSCTCVGGTAPEECTVAQHCVNRSWTTGCPGHWTCERGSCREVCGSPCGDRTCDPSEGESPWTCPSDCPPTTPCQAPSDCPGDSWCATEPGECGGVGVCRVRPTICPRIYQPVCGCDGNDYDNRCLAAVVGVGVRSEGTCPDPECRSARDCLGRPWLVDCLGRWECSARGRCREVCDFVSCGDGLCDADRGEDPGSCPRDCRADLCAFQAAPFCLPADCEQGDGSPGRCGTDSRGDCRCGPPHGTCTVDRDCLGRTWPIRCLGHWDCEKGACRPRCGEPCGNGRCEASEGEDRRSCAPDCPDRDAHCDDGTEPICLMVPPVCDEREILAYQEGCFACVNPATCRPWGEPGCGRDADCPPEQWCSPCGTSSCPLCDNCIPACVAHGCPTEPVALCQMPRPDCGRDSVAVVQEGCWVCVDRVTCR